MIDIHGHLNLEPLYENWQDFLLSAEMDGVEQIIMPGADIESSRRAIEISKVSESCHAAAGIHPHEAEEIEFDQTMSELEAIITTDKVVAIGECGLDYFNLEGDFLETMEAQKNLFTAQLELAKKHDLPVIIHAREAQSDIISLLEKHPVKGILHCFSGDQTYLKKALDLGQYISFAGNVTFKNAQDLRTLLKQVPLDRIFCETDSPFLNPARGVWPNTPAQVAKVYQTISQELGMELPDLITQIKQNVNQVFKI